MQYELDGEGFGVPSVVLIAADEADTVKLVLLDRETDKEEEPQTVVVTVELTLVDREQEGEEVLLTVAVALTVEVAEPVDVNESVASVAVVRGDTLREDVAEVVEVPKDEEVEDFVGEFDTGTPVR